MKIERKQNIINVAINEYLNTPEIVRSLTKLGRKYGIKRQTLAKHLKERNIEIINQQNRCQVDENIFNIIDTEEKAYWLGFLYADGNISSIGNRLELNLALKDLDHMIKFKNFLKYDGDIRLETNKGLGTDICRFSVRNKNIWNQLNSKGCIPCKSLILQFPNLSIFTKKVLVYDFIRGYVDGDGSLGIYTTKNSSKPELSILGTESFLKTLQEVLNIKGYIRNKSTKNYENKAFEIKFSSLSARKVAHLLYNNATIYLTRKYNIYKLFCQLEEESSRRKSSKIGKRWDANTEVTN